MEMTSVISVFIILGLVLAAAFYQLSIIVWTATIGIALLLLLVFGLLSPLLFIFMTIIFLMVAGFANLRQLRQRYIVKPALLTLKKKLPTISDTERVAIEAGDTWWEKELFCGRPRWEILFNYPRPTLSIEEQNFLDNQVDHLCSMLNEWTITSKEHDLPPQAWEFLKAEKFFGMVIPKQYGGLGFSALAHSTVVAKISSCSTSAAVTAMVPNSLGPGELLLHYGTEEQKNHYLPRLASGLEMPCFALTGPDAGSDAGSIPDSGVICRGQYEGKDIIGVRLSWDKRYITLAPVATVLGLAIKLYDPDQLLSNVQDVGITLCLIPTSHPGVEIGNRHQPMHLAFMNGPTRGKDVFIPLDMVIGGQKMLGHGWRMLMENLSIGRSISLPALATGSCKLAYRQTGAYSKIRRQFNTSIAAFEGVQEALGYIAGSTYTLESVRIMTAGAIDLKINPSIVSAIAKYHMTEMFRQTFNYSMDIHGGHGIQMGPRNFLATIYDAIPIAITVEGANILTRNLIIFGQGAIRCHPYLLKEVALISAENTDIGELDSVLMQHIGFFTGNLLRTMAFGLTGGIFIKSSAKNKRIKKLEQQITRMSAVLALLADTSLILLGGSLKRRERISARLGDILSQLYIASAVMKYFRDNNTPTSDINNVCWSLEQCLHKIQIACDELFTNFPNSIIGRLLSFIVFPAGPAYKAPNDQLHSSIVEPMLSISDFRDRITKDIFISKDTSDTGYKLDLALSKTVMVEPIQKKLHKAVQSGLIPAWYDFGQKMVAAQQINLLNTDEINLMNDYEKLREEIIKVNEFSFNLETVIA